jgi:ribosomal protein S18 acetylase RimI-like enzyme
MPEIEIRPAVAEDIPSLMLLEHDYASDYVWQMEIQPSEEDQIGVNFRMVKLPRSVKVEYPRSVEVLAEDWIKRSGILVAVHAGEVVGYLSLMLDIAPLSAWVTDLAVSRAMRRKGIGSALVLAGMAWGIQHDCYRLVLEMQPKNYPAICMAKKLGFEFCGYNDRYYSNRDIALFFAKVLR